MNEQPTNPVTVTLTMTDRERDYLHWLGSLARMRLRKALREVDTFQPKGDQSPEAAAAVLAHFQAQAAFRQQALDWLDGLRAAAAPKGALRRVPPTRD